MTMSLSEQAKSRVLKVNRRATVRYRCAPATPGKIIRTDDHELQRAWVLDVSSNGVGLEAVRPVELGAFVLVQLKSETRAYQLPAHVAHCTQKQTGEWIIGCELVQRITDSELEDLLA